jgi:hypothetical protein
LRLVNLTADLMFRFSLLRSSISLRRPRITALRVVSAVLTLSRWLLWEVRGLPEPLSASSDRCRRSFSLSRTVILVFSFRFSDASRLLRST